MVGSPPLVAGVLSVALARDPRLTVVLQVADPAQAGPAWAGCPVDVVVLELAAVASDPYAVLAALARERPDRPVLVLTTWEDDRVAAQALAHGARGCLTADSSLTDLVDAVVAVAGGATVAPRQVAGAVRGLPDSRSAASSWPDALLGYLTPRELDILRRLAGGQSTQQIAAGLGITRQTTRTHVQNVLTKLGLPSRLAAAAFAVRHGVG